jgi:hypothetical protein
VFLINVGSEAGREIAALWHKSFMDTPNSSSVRHRNGKTFQAINRAFIAFFARISG